MTFGPLGLDMNGGAVRTGGFVDAPRRSRVDVFTRRVPPAALATVELPVLGLIVLVFATSLMLAPGNLVRGTGLDLPELFICPFFALAQVPCLLCGLTRSFMAMGGLDIRQAFIYHPLGPALYVAMLGLGAAMAWSLIQRRRLNLDMSSAARKSVIRYGAVILIAAWLIKVVVWRQTGLL